MLLGELNENIPKGLCKGYLWFLKFFIICMQLLTNELRPHGNISHTNFEMQKFEFM